MKTLQQYYTQAADRPLAFSEENLRAMLSAADAAVPAQAPTYEHLPSIGSRAARVIGIGLAIAAIGTFALKPAGSIDPSVSNTTAVSSGTATSPRVQAKSPVEASATNETPTSSPIEPAPQLDLITASAQGIAQTYAPPVKPLAVAGTMLSDAFTMSEDEASKLGIRRLADGSTAYAYYLSTEASKDTEFSEEQLRRNMTDSLFVQTMSPDARGVGSRLMSRADFPLSVVGKKNSSIAHSWQVITDESGMLLDERVSVRDGNQLNYIAGLFSRGAVGDVARSVSSVRGLDEIGQSLRLNTLLPIRVSVADAAKGVFWCRPDPVLIAALPARTVAQLRSELEKTAAAVVSQRDTLAIVRRGWALTVLATIDSINPNALKVDAEIDIAAQGMTGAEIFAGSRRNAGAILRFEPAKNPASGSATMNLELEQPRRVTVTLHDVNGRKVKVLAATRSLDEGNGEIVASLSGVAKGMYLVSISTDRKEQVVQRLVIE